MLGKFGRETNERKRIELVSRDRQLAETLQQGFGVDKRYELGVSSSGIVEVAHKGLGSVSPAVLLVELDPANRDDLAALERVMRQHAPRVPVIVLTEQLYESTARSLLRLQVADWMRKSAPLAEMLQSCERVLSPDGPSAHDEATVYAFLPAAGGVGNTSLAIQSAFLLGGKRQLRSTCLVDLDFQGGAVADYLDLPCNLQLDEIAPQPERLDDQLLEVMLSRHDSGLAVVATENSLRDYSSIGMELVGRLLDLVSAKFETVVLDMPVVWLPWTEPVLRGSNRVFVVTEMTVPGLRRAQRLTKAIEATCGEDLDVSVIVNRYHASLIGGGVNSVRRKDAEVLLGDRLAGFVTEDYRLVREAIDRGVPLREIRKRNAIEADLARILLPADEKAERKRA